MMDLQSELWAATSAVQRRHLDRLRGLGVSIGALAEWALRNPYGSAHPFGVVKAEDIGGGFYQPGGGVDRVVLPVIEDGVLVDLCAFRTLDPGNWLLRTGYGWGLGLERGVGWWMWYAPASVLPNGDKRYQVGKPAHLCDTPLDWLRRGGDGICVLDWTAPEIQTLDVLPELVCSTPAVAALLTRALSRPPRLPKLSVMEVRHVA